MSRGLRCWYGCSWAQYFLLLQLLCPTYTRSGAVAQAHSPALCSVKVALIHRSEEDMMWAKIKPSVCPVYARNQDHITLQLQFYNAVHFVFTHFMDVTCTSSFLLQKNQEDGVAKRECCVWGAWEKELALLQLCVLLYVAASGHSSSLHFYFKWKKNESLLQDVQSCPRNHLLRVIYCIFSLHLHSIKPFSLVADHQISNKIRWAK